jgi:glycosyltransferase involved in cell wall biosynthesis
LRNAGMKPGNETITVFSTFPRLTDIELPERLKHVPLSGASHLDLAKAYLSNAGEERCFLFNGLCRQVWTIALLKMLLPSRRRKLVVVDMVLSVPSTRKERLVVSLRRKLFAKVDLFISYARNTKGIEDIYRIPASRFLYVPFKVNDWDTLRNLETADDGYIVVGGQTRRDFDTFRRAIEGLSIPVRIVAPAQSTLSQHGTVLSDEGWPEHVTFVRNAQTPEAFLPQLARARVVVLPILDKNITPSGIGVCLVAMALGKCVVVSSGPVADGLVDSGEAIVVPAGDWVALRDAIKSACTDSERRAATAKKGFDYAMALGDEKRLHRDVLEAIEALYRG